MNTLNRLFFSLLLLVNYNTATAEGSLELNNRECSTCYRLYLSNTNNYYPYTKDLVTNQIVDQVMAFSRLFVYAKVGEKIYLASSALGIGAEGDSKGKIELIKPDGTSIITFTSPGPNGEGFINAGLNARLREKAGPYGLFNGDISNGYAPIEYIVQEGEEGVYQVKLFPPKQVNASNVGTSAQPKLTSELSITQPTDKNVISIWDISVIDASNSNLLIKGRLFSDYLSFSAGGQTALAWTNYLKLPLITKDGYRYNITFHNLNGYGFGIMSSNMGFMNIDLTPARFSWTSFSNPADASKFKMLIPGDYTNPYIYNHHFYLNDPDYSMPHFAMREGSMRWLMPNFVNTNFEPNLKFIFDGSTTNAYSGHFEFETLNEGVPFEIKIDVNGNNSFSDNIDKSLKGITNGTLSTISWNGLDGLSNPLLAGSCINTKLILTNGEMHIGYDDIEQNPGGITIERMNGINMSNPFHIHFNDELLNDNTNNDPNYLKKTPPEGINSFVNEFQGVHTWSTGPTLPSSHTINYGNNRFMDHWAFDDNIERSAFPLTCAPEILPINWQQVKGFPNTEGYRLQWSASGLHETDIFEIQVAYNGIDFKPIAQVSASPTKSHYSFDHITSAGKVFFKIKWISKVERAEKFSSMLTLVKQASSPIQVFPNPTTDYIQLLCKERLRIKIANTNGQLRFTQTVEGSQIVQTQQWPAGVYILHWESAQQKGEQRIIKQ